jgi:hypothetical protein
MTCPTSISRMPSDSLFILRNVSPRPVVTVA